MTAPPDAGLPASEAAVRPGPRPSSGADVPGARVAFPAAEVTAPVAPVLPGPPIPVAPSWTDPTVARASEAIGGPLGRYGASSRGWSPVLVLLLLTGFTLLLAYAQKSPCADANWQHNKQYTHACYSDVIPLWNIEGLDVGAVPYRDHAVEYPVLTGGFMWASAQITRGLSGAVGGPSLVVLFAIVTCVGLAACGLLVTWFTAGTSRGRPWDAAIFALSPLLIFHAFSNWDLLAMVFTSAALWAWSRERVVTSGALIGLGAAAKLYPAVLLVVLGVLAVRTGMLRPVVRCAAAAAVAWLAVNLPAAAAYYSGWKEFYSFSASRDAEASTFWAMRQYFVTGGFHGGSSGGFVPPGAAVAAVVLVGLAIVAALGLSAPIRPRVAQLALLVVAAFLLTTKVWSPQYSLWLVPLVALARPRWRLALLWQGSEILVWIITLLWLSGFNDSDRAIDYGWLMLVILIRDGLLLTILGLVVYEMWHPSADVVRTGPRYGASGNQAGGGRSAGGVADDPGGGIFDGAPDVLSFSAAARPEHRRRREAALVDPEPDDGRGDGYTAPSG
ncbi:MAG: glycosyltransferase 87 family protein [bacterium]